MVGAYSSGEISEGGLAPPLNLRDGAFELGLDDARRADVDNRAQRSCEEHRFGLHFHRGAQAGGRSVELWRRNSATGRKGCAVLVVVGG